MPNCATCGKEHPPPCKRDLVAGRAIEATERAANTRSSARGAQKRTAQEANILGTLKQETKRTRRPLCLDCGNQHPPPCRWPKCRRRESCGLRHGFDTPCALAKQELEAKLSTTEPLPTHQPEEEPTGVHGNQFARPVVITDFETALSSPIMSRQFRKAALRSSRAPPFNAFTADQVLALQRMSRPRTLAPGEESDDINPLAMCIAAATTLQQREEVARYMNVGIFDVLPDSPTERDISSD